MYKKNSQNIQNAVSRIKFKHIPQTNDINELEKLQMLRAELVAKRKKIDEKPYFNSGYDAEKIQNELTKINNRIKSLYPALDRIKKGDVFILLESFKKCAEKMLPSHVFTAIIDESYRMVEKIKTEDKETLNML